MRIVVLLFILISSQIFVSADVIEDAFKSLSKELEKKLAGDLNSKESQDEAHFKFISQFFRQMIQAQIKMASLATDPLNPANLTNSEREELKKQVNLFVQALYGKQYSSLEDFVEKFKAENPSQNLPNQFSLSTFNEDLQQIYTQQALINAMVQQLFNPKNSAEKNLEIAFEKLEALKPFLIDVKGIPKSDVEGAISFLKDNTKVRQSIEKLVKKMLDKEMRPKLIALALKFQTTNRIEEADIMKLIADDPELMKLFADSNWKQLASLEEKLMSYAGKSYFDLINNNKSNGGSNDKNKGSKTNDYSIDDDEDDLEDEDAEKDNDEGSSGAQALLIVFSVIVLVALVFIGVRKYRQYQFFNDGSDVEKRQLYRIQE